MHSITTKFSAKTKIEKTNCTYTRPGGFQCFSISFHVHDCKKGQIFGASSQIETPSRVLYRAEDLFFSRRWKVSDHRSHDQMSLLDQWMSDVWTCLTKTAREGSWRAKKSLSQLDHWGQKLWCGWEHDGVIWHLCISIICTCVFSLVLQSWNYFGFNLWIIQGRDRRKQPALFVIKNIMIG